MQQQVRVGVLPLLATLGVLPLLVALGALPLLIALGVLPLLATLSGPAPPTPTHSLPQEETLAGSLQPGPGPLVAC